MFANTIAIAHTGFAKVSNLFQIPSKLVYIPRDFSKRSYYLEFTSSDLLNR